MHKPANFSTFLSETQKPWSWFLDVNRFAKLGERSLDVFLQMQSELLQKINELSKYYSSVHKFKLNYYNAIMPALKI